MTRHLDPNFQAEAKGDKARDFGRWAAEWAGILIAAAIFTVLMRTFVFQTFFIPSESMENTLLVGDKVIVNKLAYKTGDIHRGDVIVFERPPRETDPNIKDLIKRVIALPGDRVEAREGEVFVNGQKLDEPYIKDAHSTAGLVNQTVPENELLVLGDNRLNSSDGRVFGTIDENLVVGKASIRYWPLDRIGTLNN